FEKKKSRKIMFWTVSLLAFFNVLYLVQGKTGQFISIILFLYFLSMVGSKKQIISIMVLFIILGGIMISASNSSSNRVIHAANEIKAWEYGQPAKANSSSGLRLEWYINTAKLIIENPIFGTGTGSFETAYNRFITNTEMNRTDNPHNDFLMTAVQFGGVGLLVFLGFFGVQWVQAGRSDDMRQTFLCRGFVLTILCACMFASPIQDSAEGWFFAYMSVALFSSIKSSPLLKKA
ncbi:MAG: O-antigen ligase family protein, partial [Desulfobacterales bacterium]|nr:O-antigen ligase family protein [Desulfobacterales bacterium]